MNGMTHLITMTHMEEHLTLHLSAGGNKLTCRLHNQLHYILSSTKNKLLTFILNVLYKASTEQHKKGYSEVLSNNVLKQEQI